MKVRDITGTHRGEGRIFHSDISQLRLKLDELGEVRHQLCLPRLTELKRRINESSGDRERRESLEDDLNDLKSWIHAECCDLKVPSAISASHETSLPSCCRLRDQRASTIRRFERRSKSDNSCRTTNERACRRRRSFRDRSRIGQSPLRCYGF